MVSYVLVIFMFDDTHMIGIVRMLVHVIILCVLLLSSRIPQPPKLLALLPSKAHWMWYWLLCDHLNPVSTLACKPLAPVSPILNPLNLFSRCFEPFESAAALVTTLVSALRNPGRHDALLFVNFFSTTLLFKWKYKYKYNNKYKYVSQFRTTRCSAW